MDTPPSAIKLILGAVDVPGPLQAIHAQGETEARHAIALRRVAALLGERHQVTRQCDRPPTWLAHQARVPHYLASGERLRPVGNALPERLGRTAQASTAVDGNQGHDEVETEVGLESIPLRARVKEGALSVCRPVRQIRSEQ